jgi:predicted nucleotidyltransferase
MTKTNFRADEEALQDIVTRLVRAIDPDRIVLFGSRSRGESRPDSDFDLLIVKQSDEPPNRRVVAAYRALSGLGVPKDILWSTPEEIADWAAVPNYVTTRAIREGKLLYERPA